MTINVSASTTCSSFLRVTDLAIAHVPNAAAVRQEPVIVRRLEDVTERTHPGALVAAALPEDGHAGYDLEAFAGLGDRLRDIAVLQSELSLRPLCHDMPHWLESIRTYEGAGFQVVGFYPVSFDRHGLIQADCLMVKPGHVY